MGMFDKLFGKKRKGNLTKKCPYCGQLLDNAAFKCTRCNKWVDNEVFHRLCDDDVKLIKNKDLTPFTPTLVAAMVIYQLKESDPLEKEMQKLGKKKLTEEQRFNLLVFKSFCYFNSICSFAKMKHGCRDAIIDALRNVLLQGVSEIYLRKLERFPVEQEMKETLEAHNKRGRALYTKFEAILDGLGTNASSQLEATNALGASVLCDELPISFGGLGLYTYFMKMFQTGRAFSEMFLVEEEDFNWRGIVDI